MKIKGGQKFQSSELFYLDQNNNVKKVDILDLCKDNKTIILGMPGAFTKTCSALHLPGYVKNFELANKKGISKIVCVAVSSHATISIYIYIYILIFVVIRYFLF